ncbi:DUF4349 domain-containing protein [Bacillus shivajii]|uniref:DUF4349 domain-containing protein n=1 Tax=Bacillus shivajii TaxID=1983719 RepID=UPI001CFB8BA0|nr:DUF4349 domain-containing protein [Bacillus shivajii]UCZ54138.1 DUF4349 domain-containing protein [Bacillus shivajii]
MKNIQATFLLTFTFSLLFLLASCSNVSQDDAAEYDMGDAEYAVDDDAGFVEESEVAHDSADQEARSNEQEDSLQFENNDRMVIYNGNLSIEVNNYDDVQRQIEEEVNEVGGFIVESSIYQHGGSDENRTGNLTVRVPAEHFFSFINGIESRSTKVLEKSTHGNDVTEEYVDLESRLRSQETVEERLLNFLDEAENTEDLLQISNDLARTQEEIERLKGRMSYLENHVAYSTVSIHIQERAVNVPPIQDREELNTFERAQSLFMDTINFIITIFSGLIVFLIGLSPVLVPIILVGLAIYSYHRKQQKNNTNT